MDLLPGYDGRGPDGPGLACDGSAVRDPLTEALCAATILEGH